LSWVGTGRLNFSLDFEQSDLDLVRERMLIACRRMKADGWWYYDPKKQNNLKIKAKLGMEVVKALAKQIVGF
jgi:glutamate-1-semialdehyde 2,1-aminomutase